MTRIVVCGGRDYTNYKVIANVLSYYKSAFTNLIIITGGATGADMFAEKWAKINKVPYAAIPADFTTLGRSAGPIRNQKILDYFKPALVIAFPGGAGTADMVRRAKDNDFLVEEFNDQTTIGRDHKERAERLAGVQKTPTKTSNKVRSIQN